MTLTELAFLFPLLGCTGGLWLLFKHLLNENVYERQSRRHREIPVPLTRGQGNTHSDVLSTLDAFRDGVHKRIFEVREITECIQLRHPEMFREHLSLSAWLSDTDAFLCALRDVAWPEGSSAKHDERRAWFERRMPRPDYDAL